MMSRMVPNLVLYIPLVEADGLFNHSDLNLKDYPTLPTGVFRFTIPKNRASTRSDICTTTNDNLWNCESYAGLEMRMPVG